MATSSRSLGQYIDPKRTAHLVPCTLAVVCLVSLWPGVFPLDDAYITLHNAQVLLSGAPDHVFGSSYLVGATSAVHLALLAAFGLALPLPDAAFAICLTAAALYVGGLEMLARRHGLWGLRTFLIPALGVFWGSNVILLLNGLETGLAMAVVVWMLILCDNQRWLPILCGTAPFIRPELALLAAPLSARLAWKRQSIAPLAIAAIAAGPWMLWYLLETGTPLPSTGSAKIAFFADYREALYQKLDAAWRSLFITLFLPLAVGALGLKRLPAGWCAGLFIASWLTLATWTLPESLHWNDGRYCATLIPALLYGVVGIASERSRATDIVLALLTVIAAYSGTKAVLHYRQEVGGSAEPRGAAEAISSLPANSVVLVHDAGWSGWLQPKARLVDVVGLKTPRSQQWHRIFTRHRCAWDKALSAIARESRATHLMVLESGFWVCVETNLRRAGWTLRPLNSGRYRLFQIMAPVQPIDASASENGRRPWNRPH